MRMNVKRTLVSFIPLVVLVALLALDISIFGSDSILGASQVSLLVAAGVAVWLGMWLYRIPWKEFEREICANIGNVGSAILILLLIGAISGTWTMSGVVPSFIYYGIQIISPKLFLLTACVLCALVSVMTGSSWTTIATVGVALLGIGRAEGFSDAMTAGAIISGAYFGDKISPLSDTTVLASSVNRVAEVYSGTLAAKFHITPWLMIVPAITGFLIWKRMPAILVLALSVLTASVAALVFQPEIVRSVGEAVTEGSSARIFFTGIVESIYNSVTLDTGVAEVNQLVATRGMLGMLNTIYLILCAMCFGAAMQASGMIADMSSVLQPLTRTRGGLVGSTVLTGTALNGIVSDQYLSVILTSNIYRNAFEKGGYENRLLSRSVEDSATVTSPLFPWSSCGMTQATILSVPTLVYAPFCFFCLLSPLMSFLVAVIGWKIRRK